MVRTQYGGQCSEVKMSFDSELAKSLHNQDWPVKCQIRTINLRIPLPLPAHQQSSDQQFYANDRHCRELEAVHLQPFR